MAFIVVQHLDPNHDSMMAHLLAGHTRMPVAQASDGMTVDANTSSHSARRLYFG